MVSFISLTLIGMVFVLVANRANSLSQPYGCDKIDGQKIMCNPEVSDLLEVVCVAIYPNKQVVEALVLDVKRGNRTDLQSHYVNFTVIEDKYQTKPYPDVRERAILSIVSSDCNFFVTRRCGNIYEYQDAKAFMDVKIRENMDDFCYEPAMPLPARK